MCWTAEKSSSSNFVSNYASLSYHREEEVYMRSFVDEESDGVAIYRHFQDEVWRCARLDCWPDNAVVVGVDESLV